MKSSTGSISDADVELAFNQSNFTDMVLRIEIMGDSIHPQPDSEGCTTIADRARVRRSKDIKKENGDEAVDSNDSNLSMDYSAAAVASVKTLHISSRILADKSPFFCKLFSNEMSESEQRCVTLRIDASEEAALMELLKFMYSDTLSIKTATGLLEVLMAAKKFEVASCVTYCSRLLAIRPIRPNINSALLYQDLPSSVLMADAANQYLVGLYKDITKFSEEVMSLPLAGLEAILSSDDLQVASEDVVYDFVLKWARKHYENPEERQEVLGAQLARVIRFPYMTSRKLKKVLTCGDFDHDVASKLVIEALFSKVEAPHPEWSLTAEESASSSCPFEKRAYKYRHVKVVKFKLPRQQCVVYLDLKKEECANLFPSGRVYSQAFKFGGQGFFLSAHCNMNPQSSLQGFFPLTEQEKGSFHCFGLFLGMQEKGSVSFTVDYEFAARSRPTEEFVSRCKGDYTFTGGKAIGYRNLFAIPWTSFMAEDCAYFINGVLHLRATLTIRH